MAALTLRLPRRGYHDSPRSATKTCRRSARRMAFDTPGAADAADTISDVAEEEHHTNHQFRRRAAIVIGVLAMLLAISGLGGGNATKKMPAANIQSADTYAFYQAKNIRQTSTRSPAADEARATFVHLLRSPWRRSRANRAADRECAGHGSAQPKRPGHQRGQARTAGHRPGL